MFASNMPLLYPEQTMLRRLFIAIDLSDSVKQTLDRLCSGLPSARWSDAHQFHITLRFIGDSKHEQFLYIQERLQNIALPEFSLKLSGIGYFPQRKQEQVLWVGLDPELDAPALISLKQAVDHALGTLQLKKDSAKFVPHVTLAHLTETSLAAVELYLNQHGGYASEPFTIKAFHLYSSRLSAAGAIHTLECSFPLVPKASSRLEQRLLEFRKMQHKDGDDDD